MCPSIATQSVADCLAVEPVKMAHNRLSKLCGFPDNIYPFPQNKICSNVAYPPGVSASCLPSCTAGNS